MNYYLDYNSADNMEDFFSFLKKLDQNISELIEKDIPFISGNWEKRYNKKLDSQQLNDNGMDSDSLAGAMSDYFKGLIRWHHPFSFYNVKSPINIYSAAVSTMSMLYDANLANDKICGNMANAELEVIKYLVDIAGFESTKAGGYFTFGGTSTLLNAIKIGLNKAIPDISNMGIREDVFIVCSEQEHHSVVKCCNWIGIGKDNCVMIPTDKNYQFDIQQAERIISERIKQNQKLIAIIACGGTTAQNIIDPIYHIYEMREKLLEKHKLSYSPHLHVDAVVGWPILFFKDYSFKDNPLDFNNNSIDIIQSLYQALKDIEFADSFGVDFHKTGFCPFVSSVLVTKNIRDLINLNGDMKMDFNSMHFGQYNTCDYVLETSRSLSGVMSALTVLKLLGKNGMRSEIAKITDSNLLIRTLLSKLPEFEIINPETFGINILFIVKPKKFEYRYNDLTEMSKTKIYRLAKYNYNFYLFCMQNINKSHLFFNYTSGYAKGRNGIFMGLLQMQSFSPIVNRKHAEELIEILKYLKNEFDINYDNKSIQIEELPFVPHSFRYGFMGEGSLDKDHSKFDY